ncbi:MAG: molybdopterin cofactor-binding domain-containing protein, partial [Burkholderiales bacterium]
DEAATDAAIKSAEVVVKVRLDSPRVVPNCMEPRGGLVKYDAATDSYDVHFPTQGVAMWRPGVSHVAGIPPEKIRLHGLDVGGGYGARSGAYPDQILLMWAAKKLNRPLKWTATRSENFTTEAHGRAVILEGELALKRDGTFVAIRTKWLCDQGAYLAAAGPLTNCTNGMFTCGGTYLFQAAYGRHHILVTNTVPTNAYRGAGRPEASYIVERLVDEAAVTIGMDRAEIRRRNAIPASMMPYTNHGKMTYDSGDFPKLVEIAVDKGDWAGFAKRRAESQARGKLRGIGLALFCEISGGGVAPKDTGAVRFNTDGSVTLHSAIQPHGQGHETVFPELVGATLGIDPERISVSMNDAFSHSLMGNGVVGSRTAQQFGSAFQLAALDVIKKGRDLAAKKLEAAADDIEFAAGTYSVKGTDRRVSLLSLAADHRGPELNPLDAQGEQALSRAFPSAAHIAEIEIDPATGTTTLARYVAVDDCGVVLNHTIVEGQLQGSLAQGAGQVFGEVGAYDRQTGQLLAGSFMDYYMPRAGMIPEIESYELLNKSPTTFIGAKGVGEAGTVGALPTIMNAVLDALRPLGIKEFDMPATPARVWAALQAAKR